LVVVSSRLRAFWLKGAENKRKVQGAQAQLQNLDPCTCEKCLIALNPLFGRLLIAGPSRMLYILVGLCFLVGAFVGSVSLWMIVAWHLGMAIPWMPLFRGMITDTGFHFSSRSNVLI
jgi:hypothetical protein